MDPFATLGLPRRYDLDLAQLEARYRELQRVSHPDRHVGAGASARRLALSRAVEVNEAYRTLRDDQQRARALLRLLGDEPRQDAADPALLEEVMELREALAEARAASDDLRVEALAVQARQLREALRQELARAFSRLQQPAPPDRLRELAALVTKLRYYDRFLDDVRVVAEARGA